MTFPLCLLLCYWLLAERRLTLLKVLHLFLYVWVSVFFLSLCVFECVHTHAIVCMSENLAEGTLWVLALSLYHVHYRNRTQVLNLDRKLLYLLNTLLIHKNSFKCYLFIIFIWTEIKRCDIQFGLSFLLNKILTRISSKTHGKHTIYFISMGGKHIIIHTSLRTVIHMGWFK